MSFCAESTSTASCSTSSLSLPTESADIAHNKWLEFLLNVKEPDLLKNLSTFSIPLATTLSAGDFHTASIDDLKKQVAAALSTKESSSEKSWPLFVIRVRKESGSDNRFFDTSSLQVDTCLPTPLFQVASNFNCHENGSSFTNLFDGEYLTDLMSDATQGPAASAGAGLGAVVRWQRHRERPINLLENVSSIQVKNGKAVRIDKHEHDAAHYENVQIGLHTDTSACFERAEKNQCRFVGTAHSPLIDQVFTSTVCLPNFKNTSNVENAMNQLLRCAYEGTYLAALLRNRETLVLTLVGGGVFLNPLEHILNAMASAHVSYAQEGSLKTILLPLYEAPVRGKIIAEAARATLIAAGVPSERIEVAFF